MCITINGHTNKINACIQLQIKAILKQHHGTLDSMDIENDTTLYFSATFTDQNNAATAYDKLYELEINLDWE
jgi:hypothetical protein